MTDGLTLSNPFLFSSVLVLPHDPLLLVEETLVRSDRSEPEVLQRLHRRRGKRVRHLHLVCVCVLVLYMCVADMAALRVFLDGVRVIS